MSNACPPPWAATCKSQLPGLARRFSASCQRLSRGDSHNGRGTASAQREPLRGHTPLDYSRGMSIVHIDTTIVVRLELVVLTTYCGVPAARKAKGGGGK